MATKATSSSAIAAAVFMVAALITTVLSDDMLPVPGDKSQLTKWFNDNVKPLSSAQLEMNNNKGLRIINPKLAAAEKRVKVVKVKKDGSGDFKTVSDAIKAIPEGNRRRVIVYVGSGTYFEKIKIEKTKPFVTLFGDPKNFPNLTFDGTAQRFGTVDSASLIVESDYFVAANLVISMHSAPIPLLVRFTPND
ncbi:pectinesterase 1-like [Neltuma alba]|uniref:pectinesterase 1-like n=1 Tax=Neltuma alba TaxID=207710 RepID=UPI0010A45636|nr:pectinesterase 1-like [Prosopis alba]